MDTTFTQEQQKWLNELEVTISDESIQYTVQLKGFQSIFDFIKNEATVWKNLINEIIPQKRNSASINKMHSYFQNTLNDLTNIPVQLPQNSETGLNTLWKSVKSNIEKPPAPKKFYSVTPLGHFLIKIFKENAEIGEGCFKYFDHTAIDSNNQYLLRGYIYATLFEQGIKVETILVHLETLNRVTAEWDQKKSLLSNEFEKFTVSMTLWLDNIQSAQNKWHKETKAAQDSWDQSTKSEITTYLKEQKEKFTNLDTSYNEKLKVEAPVKYWSDRAKAYRKRGYAWLTRFTIVVILIIIFLSIVLYVPPEIFSKSLFNGDPLAIKGLIIFALIVSGLFYLAKIFSKMTYSSFHLERDAEEREQLTLVYLALTKEGKIKEEERDIMLQSLFSRVDIGILGDDSSPAFPFNNFMKGTN